MSREITPALVMRLARQTPEAMARFIARLTPEDALRFDSMFEAWAHDGQRPPDGEGWRTWLILAGRGYGKTRAGAEWVHKLAAPMSRRRVALVGATIAEARAVMVEGPSGLLAVARGHGVAVKWEPSLGRLRWPGGAVAGLQGSVLRATGTSIRLREAPRADFSLPLPVEIREGCDKLFATCSSRFANSTNFRGERHLPGNDLLTRYPGGNG